MINQELEVFLMITRMQKRWVSLAVYLLVAYLHIATSNDVEEEHLGGTRGQKNVGREQRAKEK